MIATIKAALISFTLFVSGGNILSTNFKLHHYSDDDFKDIMNLNNKASISKNCTRHSEMEDIKKIKVYREDGLKDSFVVSKKELIEKVEDKIFEKISVKKLAKKQKRDDWKRERKAQRKIKHARQEKFFA